MSIRGDVNKKKNLFPGLVQTSSETIVKIPIWEIGEKKQI